MSSVAGTLDRDLSGLPAPAVGSHAARGAVWTFAFSLLGKATTVGTQFVLAWLLVPEELGLVGLTLAVMNFTAVVGGGNLKSILVQRGSRFDEDAGHTFWLALLLNALAAVLLAALSPVAGLLFKEPRVILLLLLAAVALPIQSLNTIYVAALHRDLRFGRVSGILFGASLIQNGSAVLLATMGYGAMSLIIPWTLNAAFMALAFRFSAGRIAIGRLNVRRSLELCGPAGWLIVNGIFVALLNSGANLAIGLIQHDSTVAGYYYWGASLSCQAVFLFVTSLQGVLFPVLTRLNLEPVRQLAGALNACRTLLAVAGPVCLTQALLAGPAIRWLFDDRWQPAIGVVQWLSIGLATQPLNVLAVALLMAHGRFRQLAALNASIALSVLLTAVIGAQTGGPSDIARWTGPALLLSNFVAGLWVFRRFNAGWTQLSSIVVRPLVLTLAAGCAGLWIFRAAGDLPAPVQMLAVALTCGSVTLLMGALLLPSALAEIMGRLCRRRSDLPRPVISAPVPLAERR
jgi:PST family polysaccharide transporter